jgi:ABC-type branched-subunit amino acid transport system substrate-binding protein
VGEPDLIPYITSILAAKPDAVIFATGGASMANIMKAVKATGMAEKVGIYIHSATDHAVLNPLGIHAPEGVMGTIDYNFYYPELSSNKRFVNAFKKAHGHPPGFPAFQAYITAHFIAEAYKKAGSVNTTDSKPGGQDRNARLRSPGHSADEFWCNQSIARDGFCRRHGYRYIAGSGGHAFLPGNYGGPRPIKNQFIKFVSLLS